MLEPLIEGVNDSSYASERISSFRFQSICAILRTSLRRAPCLVRTTTSPVPLVALLFVSISVTRATKSKPRMTSAKWRKVRSHVAKRTGQHTSTSSKSVWMDSRSRDAPNGDAAKPSSHDSFRGTISPSLMKAVGTLAAALGVPMGKTCSRIGTMGMRWRTTPCTLSAVPNAEATSLRLDLGCDKTRRERGRKSLQMRLSWPASVATGKAQWQVSVRESRSGLISRLATEALSTRKRQ